MEIEFQQLIELKKIRHLLRWIAVSITGTSIGFFLLVIGARIEPGSGFNQARSYYIAGIVVFLLGMGIGLTESAKSDRVERDIHFDKGT